MSSSWYQRAGFCQGLGNVDTFERQKALMARVELLVVVAFGVSFFGGIPPAAFQRIPPPGAPLLDDRLLYHLGWHNPLFRF